MLEMLHHTEHPRSPLAEGAELPGLAVTSQQPLGATPHNKVTGCSEGDAALILYPPESLKKGSHVPPK